MSAPAVQDGVRASPTAGETLYLLCGYGGARSSQAAPANGRVQRLLRAVVRRLTLAPLREFIAAHRDFYANPREPAYMLDLAVALAREPEGAGDLVIDEKPEAASLPQPEGFGRVDRLPLDRSESWREDPLAGLAEGRYRRVVLFYPDAIGLGWRPLERRLARLGPRKVLVVNGRRRTFRLDRASRRALAWRRLLAHTRLVELALVPLVLILGATLAVLDARRGRS